MGTFNSSFHYYVYPSHNPTQPFCSRMLWSRTLFIIRCLLFYSIAQISHMYYHYLNMYQILCFVFYKYITQKMIYKYTSCGMDKSGDQPTPINPVHSPEEKEA